MLTLRCYLPPFRNTAAVAETRCAAPLLHDYYAALCAAPAEVLVWGMHVPCSPCCLGLLVALCSLPLPLGHSITADNQVLSRKKAAKDPNRVTLAMRQAKLTSAFTQVSSFLELLETGGPGA